jgi:Protein of unknown function (DUF3108)
MAGGARLSAGTGARLLALLAVVLLAHVVALQWLAEQLQQPALMRPLPTPMFTRLLRPEAPAAVPAPPEQQAVRARPRRSTITSITKPAPSPAKRAASAPVPATSEPATESAPAADAPSQPPAQDAEFATAPQTDQGAAAAMPSASATDPASASAAAASVSAAASPNAAASAPAAQSATAAAAAGTALDSWPVDTRLNYRLGGQFRNGELYGSARVQWQRQGDRYETRVEIDVTLLARLVLTSQGEVAAQGLLPRAYEELRRSGPRGVRMGNDTITLNDGRGVPRPPGVQDTASQFVDLSHRFATGKDTLEVGRSVSFWMARPGGVDLWTYDIVDRQTLRTPQLGAVEAFHLKPRSIANPRGNITAEIWLAPTLQYLPVRIRVTMGEGTYVDLLVELIEQR